MVTVADHVDQSPAALGVAALYGPPSTCTSTSFTPLPPSEAVPVTRKFPLPSGISEFADGCVMATEGAVVSMAYICVTTLPLFPAASLAKYFNVVVDDTDIEELYTELAVVGTAPFIV